MQPGLSTVVKTPCAVKYTSSPALSGESATLPCPRGPPVTGAPPSPSETSTSRRSEACEAVTPSYSYRLLASSPPPSAALSVSCCSEVNTTLEPSRDIWSPVTPTVPGSSKIGAGFASRQATSADPEPVPHALGEGSDTATVCASGVSPSTRAYNVSAGTALPAFSPVPPPHGSAVNNTVRPSAEMAPNAEMLVPQALISEVEPSPPVTPTCSGCVLPSPAYSRASRRSTNGDHAYGVVQAKCVKFAVYACSKPWLVDPPLGPKAPSSGGVLGPMCA